MIFDDSLSLKRMMHTLDKTPTSSTSGVKLPKIDVPVFDGNILHWKTFWEQFSVAVHARSDTSDAEKLVYLCHAVKDGSAKSVIKGLSRSGDHYTEAVECLRDRYDRPRLIHQVHVKKILDVPALKDGGGKELRHLHDTVQQHLRALKAMGYEPSGPFITFVLELKLNAGTMFEWQKHSHGSSGVPHYRELLEFINLRAQASSLRALEGGNEVRRSARPVTSYSVSTTPPSAEPCILCKTSSHPLFVCTKFKSLPHDKMLATIRANNICINCLCSGHFVKQCKSLHRCRECQKPHHSLLHLDQSIGAMNVAAAQGAQDSSSSVPSLTAVGLKPNSLLMTCQVLVTSPSGLSTKARALLDSASSASFVSEHLARLLRLPRSQHPTKISGIAGLTHDSSSHTVTNFHVSPCGNPNKRFDVSAIVIPRVTCNLPVHPVPVDGSWSHLDGLQLADPNFGQPNPVDILLGIDVFVCTLLHGRRAGPSGSPIALETEFGWVLAGGTEPRSPVIELTSHHVSTLSGDDLLRKFWEVEGSCFVH